MSHVWVLLAACICCAPCTFALSAEQRKPEPRTAQDEAADGQQLRSYPYSPEDPLTFDRDFGKAWDDAHALRMAEMPKENLQTRNTVNVVISLRESDELPLWCRRIIDGGWGEDVSLSVYIKTEGLKPDEEQVLKRSDRLEMIAIPNFGRNEHAYVWHLARSAPSFASVEIFTRLTVPLKEW
jgi:hypothetical protein